MTLELKNITTVVNPGTDEEKKILKNRSEEHTSELQSQR